MIATAVFALLLAQDPELAAVQQSQEQRIATMARVAPAVCSVMDMNEPGGGSGVIFDPAGFVLTNFHVVGQPNGEATGKDGKEGALPQPPKPSKEDLDAWRAQHADAKDLEEAKLTELWQTAWREENWPKGKRHWRHKKIGLPDGQLYEAVVLGIDPGSDLALLRLLPKTEGQTWPWCTLGDSDQVLVGETVFAMGNPFLLATDFTPTTTFGIVSGTHRYQEGQGNRMLVYPDCIQVDAAVNPGNSGGPLFNERGEVIGINGRISLGDRGRVNVGVGFAIASNQIRNFLGDLIAGRHAEHGTLDLSAWYMAAPRETNGRRGVFVQQMFKDSVAAAAGIALGDEITSFNGIDVRSANQLATLIGVLPAGAWVTVGHRPALVDGGYGKANTVTVRLNKLDTGSSVDASADTERLGSRNDRRIATKALAQRATAPMASGGVLLVLTPPDGSPWRFARSGEQFCIAHGDQSWVRQGDGATFRVAGSAVAELTPDETAWLAREFACNPMLWTDAMRSAQWSKGMLIGGVHVHGKPAFRYALPGDGEMEFWLFEDGAPAGYVMRDPMRKAKIEHHFRDQMVRIVVDGVLEAGWAVSKWDRNVTDDPALFRRPQ
jgi:S1-C subfamily serine protease